MNGPRRARRSATATGPAAHHGRRCPKLRAGSFFQVTCRACRGPGPSTRPRATDPNRRHADAASDSLRVNPGPGGGPGGPHSVSTHLQSHSESCRCRSRPTARGGLVELLDMPVGEGSQERSQRRGCPYPAEESAHAAVPEQVEIVDGVRAGQHQHRPPSRSSPQRWARAQTDRPAGHANRRTRPAEEPGPSPQPTPDSDHQRQAGSCEKVSLTRCPL
jgi:hypothetical protein